MSTNPWSDSPELERRYNKILSETRRLQQEFGIIPKSLEQRYADVLKRKEEERIAQEQLAIINSLPKPRLVVKKS